MGHVWGVFARKTEPWLKIAWSISAALVLLYLLVVEPRSRFMGISEQKATGLAAVAGEWQPDTVWHQSSFAAFQLGAFHRRPAMAMMASPSVPADDRKMVRTGSMNLLVKHPSDAIEQIRQIAERSGGFVTGSQIDGAEDAQMASINVRVPVARFEETRQEIRKLGLRVETEKSEAQDVTKQYVDQQARLHNLRAQEAQYLGILKYAKTVKDTLEVSDKLNAVRGEIEQQQAEFVALSKQVETVALTISLRAEADTKVFGVHWRPLYQLKLVAREGFEALADYAVAMTGLFFYLPAILAWLITILIAAAFGWRILRWASRRLFMRRNAVAAPADS